MIGLRAFFQIVKVLASLALGLGLCAALLWHLEIRPAQLRALLPQTGWFSVFLVFILSFLLALTGAHKWRLWSRALYGQEEEGEAGFYMRHTLWQSWLGQFVPPSLAVVLGRGWADQRVEKTEARPFRKGAASGVLDQAMEFVFLCGLLPAGLAVLCLDVGLDAFSYLSFFGFGGSALVCLAAVRFLRPSLMPHIWVLMGWSLIRVLLTVTRLVLGAPAWGLALDYLSIAAAAPVVALLALIPLTPGNLGLAEWGWVGVLAFAGESPVTAGLLAVGFRVLVLLVQTLLVVLYEGGVHAYSLFRRA